MSVLRHLSLSLILSAALSVVALSGTEAAGMRPLEVPLASGGTMKGAVFYPSDAPAGEVRIGPFIVAGTRDAPLKPGKHPLVVMSHGTGGWFAGHHDLASALADAGFIVAAITHPGDNPEEQGGFTGQRRFLDRPAHLIALIGYMTGGWTDSAAVDAERIGVYGFSAGGADALTLAGAIPDFARVPEHCKANGADPACGLLGPEWKGLLGKTAPVSPYRIRAVVAAAPGPGPMFDRQGLAGITAPVQIWTGDGDEVLKRPFHADHVADALGDRAVLRIVPNAGHYAFLALCTEPLRKAVPQICTDPPGFDRAAFHGQMNAEVVAFMTKALR